jgi:predicted phage terminase large subunit-like protein
LQPLKRSSFLLPLPPAQLLAAIRAERDKRAAEADRQRLLVESEAIRARCQTLAGFFREAWHVLEPNAALVWNWHLDAICDHLEAVSRGEINRLLINVPPGSSKSLLASVMWNCWEWTRPEWRSRRYLATAFNDGPVKRDTRKARDLILSSWYQTLWPDVKLTRTAEMSFANDRTGSREGIPFGSLTSQRGDRLIIDDPHSTETAESAAEREATTRKFREGATDRLNDLERSAIVVIMQRLHAEDVAGTILKLNTGYVHLCLPMEFEVEKRCSTRIGFADPRTIEGELLDPVRFTPAALDKLRVEKGSYAWAGQYQQRPAPRSGGLFRRDWFPIQDAAPTDIRWVRGWDFAGTEKKGSAEPAWTAGVKLGITPDRKFVIGHVVRDRLSPAGVERLLHATATQDGYATKVSIPQDPGQAGKAQVAAFVSKLAGFAVHFSPETGDKITRAEPVAAQAEAGNIIVVRGPWNDAFLDELGMFPNGQFADQVDALSRAFQHFVLTPAPRTISSAPTKGT